MASYNGGSRNGYSFRVITSAGFILGRCAPLPPLKTLDGGFNIKRQKQYDRYSNGSRRGWETRRRRAHEHLQIRR